MLYPTLEIEYFDNANANSRTFISLELNQDPKITYDNVSLIKDYVIIITESNVIQINSFLEDQKKQAYNNVLRIEYDLGWRTLLINYPLINKSCQYFKVFI